MDDKQIVTILIIVQISELGLNAIGSCLYAIPLCLIRHFHQPIHFLTLNVCICLIVCCSCWTVYLTINAFYPQILLNMKSCLPIFYLNTMVNCQVLYSLCMVSLNRLFIIIYKTKGLFRTKRFVLLCIIIQWICGALIPLPIFASKLPICLITTLDFNYRIYLLIIVAIIPTLCLFITNSIIFIYARSSTRRVQPIHGNDIQAPLLTNRDVRLLKHMIFMFSTFFCGWVPIYILTVVNPSSSAISLVQFNIVRLLPELSTLIIILDLFIYNHELRRYFTNRLPNRLGSQTN
ncbi:unnamed protein product [Adineta steineri]|uniref:G-protein coupled receptors family 1 profile domain-containing protein n=1 Tax=Adineta steineri TaxID=433720 RepID=A0A814KLD7_9BILA|nr:unnamed protein product [Adineta steineri]CAF1052929.1 unnamed protein product [Adineta steineri]CAF1120178.1 unnamed protein product [Adineta steineri]